MAILIFLSLTRLPRNTHHARVYHKNDTALVLTKVFYLSHRFRVNFGEVSANWQMQLNPKFCQSRSGLTMWKVIRKGVCLAGAFYCPRINSPHGFYDGNFARAVSSSQIVSFILELMM